MRLDGFQLEVVADLARFSRNPLGYVLYAFPWGEGELEGFAGPEDWQRRTLEDIGKGLLAVDEAIRLAKASGHGIGKSALVAWIILWALSTREDTRGVVTANTEAQLRTKTWPELITWHKRAINAFMFTVTSSAIFSAQEERSKTWRVDAVAWSERNTEAFAGLHNKGKRILLIFDEASAIPDPIWEVSEGALTDAETEIVWAAFGNPTRNTGRFRECFGRFRHRWHTEQIDSRAVKISNKAQIAEWITDYGEDSDFVRVRVRGVFPRVGDMQFVSSEVIEGAMRRELVRDEGATLVLGVDIARFGDDQSVLRFRCGRDARSIPAKKYRGVDTMTLAAYIAEGADRYNPARIFVDGGGVGGGVVDRLRSLNYPVTEVNNGNTARNEADYANKGSECWGLMRDWLATGCIDEDAELRADLEGRLYGYDNRPRIMLESKRDMKKRGQASPDNGDALALTFAEPVARADLALRRARAAGRRAITEYDTFG